MLRPSLRALLVLLALALGMGAMSGCSSDGDDASSGATEEGTPATGDSTDDGADDASGGSDPGGAGAPGDPAEVDCADEGEVSDAIGAEVALDPAEEVGFCSYYGADGSADAEVSVNVRVEEPPLQSLEDVERNLAGVDRVDGIGDAAWETVLPGGIVQFGAYAGDRYTAITISGGPDDVAIGRAVYALFE
jgi:hypothetical protein